jgi:ribosomal protein L11 methyltransferase PrmA
LTPDPDGPSHTPSMPDQLPCDCPACPNLFSSEAARDALRRYRRRGPDPTTRELIEAVAAQGVEGATVLDIGGGVGAVQLGLLEAGAASTDSVDFSSPYVAVAREEAERRGFADRTVHREGDFVILADEVPPADIVTLDRMICCYGDMPALVARSADHARRTIGLVYPRDTWWTRAISRLMNLAHRVGLGKLDWYIHREPAIDALIRGAGFERRFLRRHALWQVALYVRAT